VKRFTDIVCDQRSDAWRVARAGCLTGSRAADMLATLKGGGEAAARRDYRTQLCVERLTGEPQDATFVNADMQRGIELEDSAIAAYEAKTGEFVARTGFLRHLDYLAGASLDGHVGDFEGVVEVKCPRPATHLKTIRAGQVPAEYRPQLLHALWITGAAWVDFVSYCPLLPGLELFVVRLTRDEAEVAAYAEKAVAFLGEVAEELNLISELRLALEAA
jgi:predicted phage-related endonuclease